MASAKDHDGDFAGWAERQSDILKTLPSGAFGLDTRNLAEEIADLGRSEIREASSLLRQLLVHLIKLSLQPDARPADHWMDEVLTFQGDAVLACSPGIKQRIDLAAIWRLAANPATRSLRQRGVETARLPLACPLTIDDLLDAEFDPAVAVAALATALASSQRPG